MKILSFLKSSLKVITIFIPQSTLAKLAGGIAIWAVESLVKNSKTKVDDEGLVIVKKIIIDEKLKKN
jgi:hypothetical protein